MKRRVALPMMTVAVLLSGCLQIAPGASQNDNPPVSATRAPNPRPANTIVTDGSAIVGGITRSAALGFEGFTPGYIVQIGAAGTRDGFKLFCDDMTDIQGAIRPMDANESADCARSAVDFVELTVAYDALVVIGDVPLQNCISASELAYVYTHDVAKLTWRDVRAGLPLLPVKLFSPPPESAATQFFVERALNGQKSVRVGSIQNLITEGGGIGYLPLAEAQKLNGRLPILAVDDGSGCTSPSEQAVWDRSYSFLSRPLYLYVNRESLRRSEVFRFVTYLLSTSRQQCIRDAGFIPASPDTYRDEQNEIDRTLRP